MKAPPWLMPQRPKRLLILFGLLLAIVAGEQIYRWWRPTHTHDTAHYCILSSATPTQTQEVGVNMEALYAAYVEVFRSFPEVQQAHAKLELKLYRDRREFRRCNRGVGWAEAFYRSPYCSAYFSADEINPCHWMLHEGVHQLNREVAHLHLAKWADEGLSEYFSTSILRDGRLLVGTVDRNTYPVWWLEDLELSGNLDRGLEAGRVIPLRVILTGRGGPPMNRDFNLYYLHWWSLMHLLFEGQGGKYRKGALEMLREGGTLVSFEKHLGSVEQVQIEWYQHLQELRWTIFRQAAHQLGGARDIQVHPGPHPAGQFSSRPSSGRVRTGA
jgi:hypothetical protein